MGCNESILITTLGYWRASVDDFWRFARLEERRCFLDTEPGTNTARSMVNPREARSEGFIMPSIAASNSCVRPTSDS